MAEQSGFFDAHLIGGEYDRVYLANSFARYFASFIGNGVFAGKSDELMVYQTDPTSMVVKVLPGQAWINGYWYENDGEFSLPIDIADGVLNRIDLVVLRWGTVERSINLAIKKGTPAVNAVAPVVQRDSDYYELKLAEVRVTAGTVSITQANIVDTRTDTNVCGWVTGVIKQADTSQLFTQWQAAYEAAYAQWQTACEASHNKWQEAYEIEYAKAQAYYEEQKAAWERFFANTTEDSVFPVPSLDDVGKIPVINDTSDGYELKDILTLRGLNMLGAINMNGNKITGLPTPTTGSEPATKDFVENFSIEGSLPVKAHLANKSNPHGVTIEQIGAAPAGYGLGTEGKVVEEIDSLFGTGVYLWEDAIQYPFRAGLCLHIERFKSGSYATQYCFKSDTYNPTMCVRNKAECIWGEWEWENPPMSPGVEYRTTERWNGRPVYAKTIECGALGNNTADDITHYTANIVVAWVCGGYYQTEYGIYSLPYVGSVDGSQVFASATENIIHRVNKGMGSVAAMAVAIKYIKSTD